MLVNGETREAAMEFLGAVIERNQKRAQLQTDERMVAGEGFMLNALTVMQQLSVKIKLDKVKLYIFIFIRTLLSLLLIFSSSRSHVPPCYNLISPMATCFHTVLTMICFKTH